MREQGFSLTEIMISLGLLGAVSLGVVKMIGNAEKNKISANHKFNTVIIERIAEGHFYTSKGCEDLKTKKIGSEIEFKAGNILFKKTTKVESVEIQGIKLEGFAATDGLGQRGLTSVVLNLKRGNKTFIKQIPVPVNVKIVGADKVIEDCHLNYGRTFEETLRKVCEGTYGSMTKGMTCLEAAALVQKMMIEEICKDVYGGNSPNYNAQSCDLKRVHINQSCGADGKAVGFDANGKIICG